MNIVKGSKEYNKIARINRPDWQLEQQASIQLIIIQKHTPHPHLPPKKHNKVDIDVQ